LISLFSGLDGPEFLKTGLLYNKYKNQANKFAWQKKTGLDEIPLFKTKSYAKIKRTSLFHREE